MQPIRPAAQSDAIRESVSKLASAAEKLLFETQRLRRDVVDLNRRITAFEGDSRLQDEPPQPPRKNWRAIDALNVIAEARIMIFNCEHELSAIRARIDTIESDAVSREDMKPWIKGSS